MLRSVVVWLFLCSVECSGDQQCKWPSNDANLVKDFYELVAFEGRFQTLNCSLFLCYQKAPVHTTTCFNISMKVTNLLPFYAEYELHNYSDV
jgi:hypothetical protein